MQIVMSLPEGQVSNLHPDIYTIAFRILEDECNLGGIEGAKAIKNEEVLWLAVVAKLFKLCQTHLDEKSFSSSEIESIVKWYLLNNDYEEHPSNPLNRSQSVSNMKAIIQRVSEVINWVGGAKNITKVLNIYSELKENVKKDSKRLNSTKYLILNRLQHGVCKLLQNNLEHESLTEVLVG